MAQSNLRAPQWEAFVFARAARLFQPRERPNHRNDGPGRHADHDDEASRLRQVIAFHFSGEKFAAELAERRRERRSRLFVAIGGSAEFAISRLIIGIGNRVRWTQSDRQFFAAVRSKLS